MPTANNTYDRPILGEAITTAVHSYRHGEARLNNEAIILAHLSRQLAATQPKWQIGDRVILEMTPFDMSKGRVINIISRETQINSDTASDFWK